MEKKGGNKGLRRKREGLHALKLVAVSCGAQPHHHLRATGIFSKLSPYALRQPHRCVFHQRRLQRWSHHRRRGWQGMRRFW
ncbi:hypothetical protein glysoja_036365 [Glycine soja]|uniref:Uncharacterized protein n=1 Tax=Glycine soja TaxID=3848 RepID=A0A0B2QRX8_GLYSO|nr:hypothetical protein glysoja_036365 [Glycine soja]